MRLSRRPARLAALGGVAGLAALTIGGVLPAAPAPAAATTAAPPPSCAEIDSDTAVEQYDGKSTPLDLLGVPKAQRLWDRTGAEPGAGVGVAVLDSGIHPGGGLHVAEGTNVTGMRELVDWHGTAVAGLIGGAPLADGSPVGVAPGARLYDVRVYDSSDEEPGQGEQRVTPDGLAAGLEWVAHNAGRLGIEVANVSLGVDPTARLRAAVRRLWRADVVVVASSGNRPGEGAFLSDVFGEEREPGEDAAGLVYPAAYPHVLAVNATATPVADDASQWVLQNSDTDVAAPTYGGLSVALNGALCQLPEVATSWSAAEVSGVIALLRARYPNDSAAQAVARLLNTANGSTVTPSRLTGVGVVQPYQALTRPLSPTRSGRVQVSVTEHDEVPATPPARPDDLLAGTRRDAVWWGLLGGGVLVVALLLRPVLARRRR